MEVAVTYGRPDVSCTFDVMQGCDDYFADAQSKQECRSGARDAYLDGAWAEGEGFAYEAGRNTTLLACAQLVVEPR